MNELSPEALRVLRGVFFSDLQLPVNVAAQIVEIQEWIEANSEKETKKEKR